MCGCVVVGGRVEGGEGWVGIGCFGGETDRTDEEATDIPPHTLNQTRTHTDTTAVMTDDGLFVEVTNSVAKKWFRGIDELLCHDQFKHRMLSNLLMLAYVLSLPALASPPPLDWVRALAWSNPLESPLTFLHDTATYTHTRTRIQAGGPGGQGRVRDDDPADEPVPDQGPHHQDHQGTYEARSRSEARSAHFVLACVACTEGRSILSNPSGRTGPDAPHPPFFHPPNRGPHIFTPPPTHYYQHTQKKQGVQSPGGRPAVPDGGPPPLP